MLRHPCDLCLAYLCQVPAASHTTAYLPISRTALHPTSQTVLYACNRLHELTAGDEHATDPICARSSGDVGTRRGQRQHRTQGQKLHLVEPPDEAAQLGTYERKVRVREVRRVVVVVVVADIIHSRQLLSWRAGGPWDRHGL